MLDKLNIHSTVKFWGRKDPSIFNGIIESGSTIIDPFCGSGTTGYVAVLKKASALLSDLNPVSVFISENILNDFYLDENMVKKVINTLKDIEKAAYSIKVNGKRYILHEAVYKSFFICPRCGRLVDDSKRDYARRIVCKCGRSFNQRKSDVVEKVVEVYAKDGKKVVKLDPFDYDLDVEIDSWYPKRRFEYYRGRPFKNKPNVADRVDQIFFDRGLYAASKTYEFIESIDDDSVSDFLKLVFIASLFSATKMIPNSKTSGPSWKIPRYWTPPEKVERNFIQTFIRRLRIINEFKKAWSSYVKDYKFFVDYFGNIETFDDRYISITRADARELDPSETYDVSILDPPHYGEIRYYEMTFLWQCWLYGKKRDKRFKDFSFWKKEIDVNPILGRDLTKFNEEILNVVSKYLDYTSKTYLILHNSNRRQFNSTLRLLKKYWNIKLDKVKLGVPTSAQGIHGKRKKYLYLLTITHKA